MLQRTRSSVLQVNEERLVCLRGQPYTGLVYVEAQDGSLTALHEYAAGVFQRESADWFLPDPSTVRVVRSVLEEHEEGGPLYRGETLFTGVVYWFNAAGQCASEDVFEHGETVYRYTRSWFASGAPSHITQDGRSVALDEQGQVLAARLPGRTVLNLLFDKQNKVSQLVLQEPSGEVQGYGWQPNDIVQRVASAGISSQLVLIGAAIDTAFLQALVARLPEDQPLRFVLINTQINASTLQWLASVPHLQAIELRDESTLLDADLDAFRHARPDCKLTVERPLPQSDD